MAFVPFCKGTRPHSADEGQSWKEAQVANTLNTFDVGEGRCNELTVQAFGISSKDSNGMKSANPHVGFYEANASRTLDGNGGNPSCNQGGIAVVESYEIKTGLSRAKLSHLMDAETWMDANKAVELGFADDILKRSDVQDMEPPAVSMLYSKAAVVNSLMDKIAAKCRTNPKKIEDSKPKGRSVDSLYERLNLLKN